MTDSFKTRRRQWEDPVEHHTNLSAFLGHVTLPAASKCFLLLYSLKQRYTTIHLFLNSDSQHFWVYSRLVFTVRIAGYLH